MTSKLLAVVLLLTSFGLAQGVAGDPGVGDSGSAAAPATPVRASNAASGNGTAINSGSFTVVNGDLVYGYMTGFGGSVTADGGAGFSLDSGCGNGSTVLCEHRINSGTSASATATQSTGVWIAYGIGFKASGTPAFVQGAAVAPSGATNGTATFPGSITTGNLVIACVRLTNAPNGATTVFTFSSPHVSAWIDAGQGVVHAAPSFTLDVQCKVGMASGAGANTVQISWDGGTASGSIDVAEFSGIVSN